MTARTEVWNLLLTHQDQWVPRAEIEKVGGLESLRRLREIRSTALGQGYTFEQQKKNGLLEYRLTRLAEQRSKHQPWRCAKCGAEPSTDPQPSTDQLDRWRIAWCVPCGNKRAIFEREHR